ncbi:MAG: heparinase II/III-family protein [Saprospiraceae bacterium]|nr:heparinase II/III-family protein [Saprospiraceae bacterium]
MKRFYKILFCLFVTQTSFALLYGNADAHPRIYITAEAKGDFLQSIQQADWKAKIVEDKKTTLDKYLKYCAEDPQWLVSRLQMNWKTKHDKVYLRGGKFSHSAGTAPVPTVRFSGTRDWATDYRSQRIEEIEPYFDDQRGMFLIKKSTGEKEWVHPSKTGHIIEKTNERIMNLVADAAFLYWLTGETKYAEFAAPVYDTYMKGMYHRDAPQDLDETPQQRLSGLATFEVIHEGIVIPLVTTYDFMFDYFKEKEYGLGTSVQVFQKWADQIIKNGVPDNNWNFFQARFLTYIALALDEDANYSNGKGQAYYLNQIFDVTTERQIGLKVAILVYDQQNGIWPESPSYSMHVTTTLLRILTLLDNVTNGNEFKKYPIVEKASLAAFQYLFPSGYTVGFGDSGHGSIPTENFELLISNYRKYGETEKEVLLSGMLKNGLRQSPHKARGRGLFELFFYTDTLRETEDVSFEELLAKLTTPTFYAPNVSLFIQRMGSKADAMMASTVGSYGNHAHANGIALEIYANNYVLGPDMGRGPSYWHPDHRDYYSQLPAHNTVVVDGRSSYSAMRSYHPFRLDQHYPKVGDPTPVFEQVFFSKVSFVEPKTQSDQQRLTALINSSAGNGYIVDVFRSKKQKTDAQRHEYFYHNLGHSLTFMDGKNDPLPLTTTDELGSLPKELKAYSYLSDQHTLSYDEDLQAIFRIKGDGAADNLMKMWVKGSDQQRFFSVMSPKSNALNGKTAPPALVEEKIPTVIIRKDHEAWTDPFVVLFNPFIESNNRIISSVHFEESISNQGAQLIQVKHSDEKTEDYIVATTSANDVVDEDALYLKGLLAIERCLEQQLEFLFLAAATRYSAKGWSIVSIDEPATVSIERSDVGFVIQNDRPIVVGVPRELKPAYIEYYEDGKVTNKRIGIIGRRNPTQVNFRLEKPYQKVIVVLNK